MAASPYIRRLVPLTVAAALLGACNDGGVPAVDVARSTKLRATPTVSEADRKAVADGNVGFALDLYHQLKGEPTNLVFSPLSISIALAMTWAGARGDTEAEMAQALRFPLPQERQHAAMNEIDAALAARGAGKKGADGKPFRLNVVNATWMQRGAVFLPTYLDVLAEHYGAGVNLLDFIGDTEQSRRTINAWVEAKTEDRIKELIPQGVLDAATRLVLTNAVYFNGAWKSPFDGKTEDGTFKRLDGSTATAPMMRHTQPAALRAFDFGTHTAVALPYDDERLSLLLVVPDQGMFADIESGFSGPVLTATVGALQPRTVRLVLPRFRFETPVKLKEVLQARGMKKAFEPGQADFSGMDGGMNMLYIQAVLHKAFIAVAEKGTEAAAATAVVAGATSAPTDVLELTVDRPFLFFLRDEPTGAILFMGRVLDPGQTAGE